MAENILLEASNVSKHFGGVQACEGVSIRVREGAIHAVIGPNGAGKTTFFNALSGYYLPDRGRVFFRGEEITRIPNWRRVALGMSRTFQTPSIFPELTVHENVLLGVRSRQGLAFRAQPPSGEQRKALEKRVDELLGFVNLSRSKDRLVAELAHGAQRLCEIAMSLSTDPGSGAARRTDGRAGRERDRARRRRDSRPARPARVDRALRRAQHARRAFARRAASRCSTAGACLPKERPQEIARQRRGAATPISASEVLDHV
jgi:ABC-type branched-subunit amino acid transport system ATPase component